MKKCERFLRALFQELRPEWSFERQERTLGWELVYTKEGSQIPTLWIRGWNADGTAHVQLDYPKARFKLFLKDGVSRPLELSGNVPRFVLGALVSAMETEG